MEEKTFRNLWDAMSDEQKLQLSHAAAAWNYLDEENIYFYMDDFDDIFADHPPWELARDVAYGEFKAEDDFFYIDVYGRIHTFSKYDLHEYLEDLYDDIYYFMNDKEDALEEWECNLTDEDKETIIEQVEKLPDEEREEILNMFK